MNEFNKRASLAHEVFDAKVRFDKAERERDVTNGLCNAAGERWMDALDKLGEYDANRAPEEKA